MTGGHSDRGWARSHGTYISGKAHIDGVDQVAIEMEAKWGADRLRLLVSTELREKFDRQRYKFNQAIWAGSLEDVRQQSERMLKAWRALDRAAEAAGQAKLSPMAWEVTLADGTVAAIVPSEEHASAVRADGRRLAVYTLEEMGRFLSVYSHVARAKATFPGAKVAQIAKSISDPLDAIHDTDEPLNDPLDDIGR